MFNENFYPTPEKLIKKMLEGRWGENIGCYSRILEPSAGKGDICEYLIEKENVENKKIDVIEIENDLQNILFSKGVNVVAKDFLSFSTATEYDYIIANPPFDNGCKHILKMISLAESQVSPCCIITLCNAETIKNPFTKERQFLKNKLDFYGAEIEFIKDAFKDAERKTNVEVALIRFRVGIQKKEKAFKSFDRIIKRMKEKGKKEKTSFNEVALVNNKISLPIDEIDSLIIFYQKQVRTLKELIKKNEEYNFTMSFLEKEFIGKDNFYYNGNKIDYDTELTFLRKHYWKKVLFFKEITKFLTNKAKEDLLNKILELKDLEFNRENIELMLNSILTNGKDILLESLNTFFDNVTKYHQAEFSKNIHYYNGWKTNSAFKINKKIIIPYYDGWWGEWYFSGSYKREESIDNLAHNIRIFIRDLEKTFKLAGQKDFGELVSLGNWTFENNLLKLKVYKKGTFHITFKDTKILDRINFLVGQGKNWIPTNEEIEKDKEAFNFVKENFETILNNSNKQKALPSLEL